MSQLIKIIKENRLSKNPDELIVIELFSCFKKYHRDSKYKSIDINSSLQEIERIAPFSEIRDEFERNIKNAIEKDKYRSDELQSIEKKYSDLERTVGIVNQFNDWPLELAVYKALDETDELFIDDFNSLIAKRHKEAMFSFDDIIQDLEIIASAIHDYKMREYLKARIIAKIKDDLLNLGTDYKIFEQTKIPDFTIVEQSLLNNGFIDENMAWQKQNNELIALILILRDEGYFKKKKHSGVVRKKGSETNFIALEITQFFESRYQIDLTNQRKESYIFNNKEKINKLSRYITSIVKV